MKQTFVKDLKKNDNLSEEEFVVSLVKKNITKTGSEYYRLDLSDKTGTIAANIWEDSIPQSDLEAMKEGTVVKVWGKIEEYKGAKQLKIISLGAATDYDVNNFISASTRDVDEMWSEFKKHILSIDDLNIKKLIEKIFTNSDFAEKFKTHPAAEKIHHAFKSGLLEHVLEMLDLSEVMFKYYPNVNKSLVKAGIILHDIGKLREIDNNVVSYKKSVEGRLIGHIIQSYEILCEFADENFPKELLTKLKHIILSHHGMLEYGSPVLPMTIESIMVSQLDNASAQTRIYERIIRENESKTEDFSDRDFILGTMVYLK